MRGFAARPVVWRPWVSCLLKDFFKRFTLPRRSLPMYKVDSRSNLNISIKRQRVDLEISLFLNFSQDSNCRFKCTCCSAHTPFKGSGNLIFSNGPHDPYPPHLEAATLLRLCAVNRCAPYAAVILENVVFSELI